MAEVPDVYHEHFRDFLHPQADEFAAKVLHPEADATHRFLVKNGEWLLSRIGGLQFNKRSDGERWAFPYGRYERVVLNIHEPDIVIPALLRYGTIGAFYSYTGETKPLWEPDTDATYIPDKVHSGNPEADSLVSTAEALSVAARVPQKLGYLAASVVAPIRDRKALRQWKESTDRTKTEIGTHYNLSQDVYTGRFGFLDRYVQYSSGLLLPGQEDASLEQLQRQKIDSLARKLELDTAQTLLEVGGGWGGLAVELAERYPHLRITSLTVSDEQLTRAKQRAAEAGVADRVQFLGKDYRDLPGDPKFDRVVSVEMIEAVAWQDLDTYLRALADFVDPKKGVIVLQAITIPKSHYAHQRHNKTFANTAIFPGGMLTPKEVIDEKMAKLGWPLHEATELTSSYAVTLREWIHNLSAHKPALTGKWLSEGVSQDKIDRFYRGFSFYLAFSQAGFRPMTGNIQDWQLTYRAA